MVPIQHSAQAFFTPYPARHRYTHEPGTFPIRHVEIDWPRLNAQRATVHATIDGMPNYLLKLEVLALFAAEKHPTYRLILDLMWITGAEVAEVLVLTPASVLDDGYHLEVILWTLKQRPGGPSTRHSKRYVPIQDSGLQDRLQSYLAAGRFRHETAVPAKRSTATFTPWSSGQGVRRSGLPVIHFRHSFAIHLLLHARSLKVVSQFLGHKSIDSTKIYTNVLTVDGAHILDGVDFH